MTSDQCVSARALWFPKAGVASLRDETVSMAGEDAVLVRTLYSGISRGTEALVFQGNVPESEEERMRGPHMSGSFSFPVKYGYASVGEVIAGPARLKGRTVFCLHPHQDVFSVSAEMVNLLPEHIPPSRAVLGANMETALNIIWDAGVLPGDRVAVFGAGVVGSLVAYIASGICGTETVLIDPNPDRLALADALGISFRNSGYEGEFDVGINASGSGEALSEAIGHAGHEARIVEASWHGDKPVTLPLGGPFHARRLSIVSSQVGTIPPGQRARWSFSRRMQKGLSLLSDDRLEALVSGETSFCDLEEAYPAIIADPATLCHRICY